MNGIDLVVFALILFFGVRGFRKGFVREGSEAVAAGVGLFVAYRTFADVASWTSVYTRLPLAVTRPVLFVAIALAIASVGFGIAALLHHYLIHPSSWKRADGWLGLGFGALKGTFLCGLLLVMLTQLPLASVANALQDSAAGRAVFFAMPEFYRYVDHWIERIE